MVTAKKSSPDEDTSTNNNEQILTNERLYSVSILRKKCFVPCRCNIVFARLFVVDCKFSFEQGLLLSWIVKQKKIVNLEVLMSIFARHEQGLHTISFFIESFSKLIDDLSSDLIELQL